jgi:Tfp pilus assembly PilM family ATPase
MTPPASLFASPAPPAAVEIAPRFVSAVSTAQHGGAAVISSYAIEPLPAGAVTPSLNGPNIADPERVASAVRNVFAQLGGRPRRVALVVPDSLAKVSLVRLDKVPARAEDLDQLIRFHVRKSAPFRVEDAQVTYSPGAALPDGGREFVVAVARRDLVREYEVACEAAGAHAGLVDLVTFSLVNAVLAAEQRLAGDWLLVHLTPDYATIVILRGEDAIFYRNRAEGSDETLADLVHQTAMYYEDRLGGTGGFKRVMLVGTGSVDGHGLDAVRRDIEGRLRVRTESIAADRIARFTDRISADRGLLDTITPLAGILARGRAAVQGRA